MAAPMAPRALPMQVRLRPRFGMGSGAMSERTVGEPALSEIRKNAAGAIQALAVQLDFVAIEAGLLSPSSGEDSLEVVAAGISFSEGFSVPELRTLIYSDALALSDLASGMKAGAIGSYLTLDQKQSLNSILAQAAQVGATVKATGLMSQIPEARRRSVEDHNAMHTQEVLDFVKEAEKAVVSAEAGAGGSVPVLEPYERAEMTNKVVLIGVVAAAVAAVIYFS